MKEAWHLAASDGALSAPQIITLYSKRWTIEPSFRDSKDLRFGMVSQTQKRSLAAIAARLMPSSVILSWSCARRSRSRLSRRPMIRIA